MLKKVTKNTIKKIIRENGYVKFLAVPCKMNINSPWCVPVEMEVNTLEELEKDLNAFYYYNCSNEAGKYPHYYI